MSVFGSSFLSYSTSFITHKCSYFAGNPLAVAPLQLLNRKVWAVRPMRMGLLKCQLLKNHLELKMLFSCRSGTVSIKKKFIKTTVKDSELHSIT